ncbi:MAG: hypothetical protein GOP50_03395 [Candidatus Heimdallarchaeota archaeon]|nr:hypothetical protein [Candidatus Heimdallarchaeota archaeon]
MVDLSLIEPASFFIIVSSVINMAFSLALVITLLVNFFRKKTVGTFMLLSSYFLFSLTSAFSIAYRISLIYNEGVMTDTIYQMGSLTPMIILPAFAFLYFFGCRHILKDNEIVKTYLFAIIMVIYGLITAVIAYDNIYTNSLFSEPTYITNDVFTISYTWPILVAQIVISIFVTSRIGIRALRLARKSDQPIRKRGLQTIGIGVFLYLLAGLLSAFDSSISNLPALMITVSAFRALAYATAYVTMYLGWVMPAWYRKMIRKKSWFEMQYQQLQKR